MPFSPKLVRIARRLLIGLGVFATTIALAVAIENWRGNRVWHRYATEQSARGINLTAIPQPSGLPPDSNFMKSPTLDRMLWASSTGAVFSEFFTAHKLPRIQVSKTSVWQKGHPLDLERFVERYIAEKKTADPAAIAALPGSAEKLLALQLPLSPVLEELRQAARGRKESQLARTNSINRDNPFGTPFASFQFIRALIIAQSSHACARLATNQPQEALFDTLAGLKLARGLSEAPDPMLVETMIGTVTAGIALQPVWEGLQKRAWNDADLVLLGRELSRTDLVDSLDRSIHLERVASSLMLDRLTWRNAVDSEIKAAHMVPFCLFFPTGWIQQNKLRLNQWSDRVRDTLASRGSAGFLHKLQHIDDGYEKLGGPFAPYTMLVATILPAHMKITQNVLQKQTFLTLALTACALERHWLAHGRYPETLPELVPTYIDKVPVDLIDGQPLRYRRTDDGKFLLYSLGLDGKDDGGKLSASEKPEDAGDWAWPTPVPGGK